MASATSATTAPTESGGVSRREFLYYIWGASIALFGAQFTGLLVWFMLPRFGEGEFGGTFTLDASLLPGVNQPPVANAEGRFWLVNLDSTQPNRLMFQYTDEDQPIQGVAAVYKVCTHLGCIYDWNEANDRFECPCHGSKYRLDGRRYQIPAPRTLDRFFVRALDADGNELAASQQDPNTGEFLPLVLPAGTAQVQVDTGRLNQGGDTIEMGTEPQGRPVE
jgi:cytochrome b6-f complex iron-sulfur subunit